MRRPPIGLRPLPLPLSLHLSYPEPMHRIFSLALLSSLLLFACGGSETVDREGRGSFRKGPISIRGWISEIDLGQVPERDVFSVTELNQRQTAYQRQLLEEAAMSIEGVDYASGRVLDTGAFIVLDAPPGDLLVNFQAPGVSLVQLPLRRIPPNADVFIPGVKLYPDRLEIVNPDQIVVRVPSEASERTKRPEQALVGEHAVDVWDVPLREMMDRRDMPIPN